MLSLYWKTEQILASSFQTHLYNQHTVSVCTEMSPVRADSPVFNSKYMDAVWQHEGWQSTGCFVRDYAALAYIQEFMLKMLT